MSREGEKKGRPLGAPAAEDEVNKDIRGGETESVRASHTASITTSHQKIPIVEWVMFLAEKINNER